MDVNIVWDNIWAYVSPSEHEKEIANLLKEALKYRQDGYQYTTLFKRGKWDGYTNLYDSKNHRFRRGLLGRAHDILTKSGYFVKTQRGAPRSQEVPHKLIGSVIKPFAFLQGIVDAVADEEMGIVVSPTGTGKTVMIALLLNHLKRISMVLVTDVVLLDQMQQSLQRYFNQPIGIIGDGEFDLQDITVSTIQSIASIFRASGKDTSRLKPLTAHLKNVGVVISDEAHLYDSDGVNELMPLFVHTERFYGMSATPYGWAEKMPKRQNLELEQHFGQVIYDCRDNDFIGLGLKIPLYVQVLDRNPIASTYDKHKKYDKFKRKMDVDTTKNYKDCLDTEILNNPAYHDDVARRAIELNAAGKSVFVHAAHSIAFGKAIVDKIPGAVLVNGSTPRLDRRRIYDSMRKKELMTIVSDVGGTGLDIPSLDSIILASDLKDVRQIKGRVERACQGKDYGLLVDVHTRCTFLAKHHDIRRSQYDHDKHTIIG